MNSDKTGDLSLYDTSPSDVNPALRLMWSSEEIQEAVTKIAKQLVSSFSEIETVNLIPIMSGALSFTASLSAILEDLAPGKWVIAPIFASAYDDDKKIGPPIVEFPTRFNDRVDFNAPAVIVDDMLDSGVTMTTVVEILSSKGFSDIQICVLVDRILPRKNNIVADFHALEVGTDHWLVGFGFDTDQRFRGTSAVYYLEQ